jgi:hypothetical protein
MPRLVAETTIKAQLIHWFQAVKMKIWPKTFASTYYSEKEPKHVAVFLSRDIFFMTLGRSIGRTLISIVCGYALLLLHCRRGLLSFASSPFQKRSFSIADRQCREWLAPDGSQQIWF